MTEKPLKLRADQIRALAPGRGGCLASDHITVEGHPVGYLCREHPHDRSDSGWRFFSGRESEPYVNDSAKLGIYDVNTIANYDPAIIPLLDFPFGSAFTRDERSGRFVEQAFSPPSNDSKVGRDRSFQRAAYSWISLTITLIWGGVTGVLALEASGAEGPISGLVDWLICVAGVVIGMVLATVFAAAGACSRGRYRRHATAALCLCILVWAAALVSWALSSWGPAS